MTADITLQTSRHRWVQTRTENKTFSHRGRQKDDWFPGIYHLKKTVTKQFLSVNYIITQFINQDSTAAYRTAIVGKK